MVTTTGDLATQAGEDLDIPADGDTPFCIIYTAAMGGTPRGAVLSHANFIFSNLQTIATLHLNHGDTYLNMLPLFHITGLNLALSVMHAGGQNAIIERFNAVAKKERGVVWRSETAVTEDLLNNEEELTLSGQRTSSFGRANLPRP